MFNVVGPFPTSKNGYKYLLTFIDKFTRYAEAVPLKTLMAEETAQTFVREIVLRHGAPKRLLTDRGTNFTSDLFKATGKLLGIKKVQTTAFHPQCYGMIERIHRTLVDNVSCFVRRDGRDWDVWIPFALMAYRSSTHTSMGQPTLPSV